MKPNEAKMIYLVNAQEAEFQDGHDCPSQFLLRSILHPVELIIIYYV